MELRQSRRFNMAKKVQQPAKSRKQNPKTLMLAITAISELQFQQWASKKTTTKASKDTETTEAQGIEENSSKESDEEGRREEGGQENREEERSAGEMTKEFLYSPPPGAFESHGDETRAWHKKMTSVYASSDRRFHNLLYRWLRRAGVNESEMEKYGVEPPVMREGVPSLTTKAYSQLFDHGRVIKRRSDGALFVLGEPYNDLADLETDPHVQAWRALGSEVICSEDSGWVPHSTVMLLIGEPKKKGGAAK
jgi:hypothetical protein